MPEQFTEADFAQSNVFTEADFGGPQLPPPGPDRKALLRSQLEEERRSGGASTIQNILASDPVQGFVHGLAPQTWFDLIGKGVSGGLNTALDVSSRAQGLGDYPDIYQAGKSPVEVPWAHPEIEGLARPNPVKVALGRFAEGLMTPENLFLAPLAAGPGAVGKGTQLAFASSMAPAAVEKTGEALNPEAPDFDRAVAAIEAGLSALFAGKLAKSGSLPIEPRPSGLAGVETFSERRAGDSQGPEGRTIKTESGEFQNVRPASGIDIPILGEQPKPRIREVVIEPSTEIVPGRAQPVTSPRIAGEVSEGGVQAPGGKISFAAPAEARAVPSARQAGLERTEPQVQVPEPRLVEPETPYRVEPKPESPQLQALRKTREKADAQGQMDKVTEIDEQIRKLSGPTPEAPQGTPYSAPGGKRIQESAGQTMHPTLEAHNKALEQAGFPRETKEAWQKFNEEQIAEFVEAPAIPLVRRVLQEGNTPISSNAYGPGQKGVWFEKPNGEQGFYPLGGMKIKEAMERGRQAGAIISPLEVVQKGAEAVRKGVETVARPIDRALTEPYSEMIRKRLGGQGGPATEKFVEDAGTITFRQKQLEGELSKVVNPAKRATAVAFRGGTTWMHGIKKVTPDTAFNNFFGQNEGAVTVPKVAKRGIDLVNKANLTAGEMAKRGNPKFEPTGRFARYLTREGYDILVKGGDHLDRWINGMAKLNKMSYDKVEGIMKEFREALVDPTVDVGRLDKIAQDFERKIPRTITHVKTMTGWTPVVVAEPVPYLERMSKTITSAVAFRERFPKGSDALQRTREMVKSELQNKGKISRFEDTIKTLQSHPLDIIKMGPELATLEKNILGPIKTAKLTAAVIPNTAELGIGATPLTLGYSNVGRALVKMAREGGYGKMKEALEIAGDVDSLVRNNAFDPTSKFGSSMRILQNAVRKVTGNDLLNEVQEFEGASTARVVADRIINKKISKGGLKDMQAVFRAMKFSPEQVRKMAAGDKALLDQFVSEFAPWATGGHLSMAEHSRWGASRTANLLFWFQRYPQGVMNRLRSTGANTWASGHNWIQKPTPENWSTFYRDAKLATKLWVGTGIQGALASALAALASYGVYGLGQEANEAREHWMRYGINAATTGMGGLAQMGKRLSENVEGGASWQKEMTGFIPILNTAKDVGDVIGNEGKYSGRDTLSKIGTFLESQAPISRPVRLGLAITGLVHDDPELNAAMNSFYKWRREQPGFKHGGMQEGGLDEDKVLQRQIRVVVEKLQKGQDWVSELRKVQDLPGAARKLGAKTLLEVNGKALTEEQLADLKKNIGAKGLEKIQIRDAMLREISRELTERTPTGERKTVEQLLPVTGTKATDVETDTQREARVVSRLSPSIQEVLKRTESSVGYEPRLGPSKELLSSKEGQVYEEEFVKAVNDLMDGAIDPEWDLATQRKTIQRLIGAARKIADAETGSRLGR